MTVLVHTLPAIPQLSRKSPVHWQCSRPQLWPHPQDRHLEAELACLIACGPGPNTRKGQPSRNCYRPPEEPASFDSNGHFPAPCQDPSHPDQICLEAEVLPATGNWGPPSPGHRVIPLRSTP